MNFVKLKTSISIIHESTRFFEKFFFVKCLDHWERKLNILLLITRFKGPLDFKGGHFEMKIRQGEKKIHVNFGGSFSKN